MKMLVGAKKFCHNGGMKAHDIIHAFGGRQVVAEIVGAKPTAVGMWRKNGVPSKYWPTLVNAAKLRRVRGVTFDVLQGSKPCSPKIG